MPLRPGGTIEAGLFRSGRLSAQVNGLAGAAAIAVNELVGLGRGVQRIALH